MDIRQYAAYSKEGKDWSEAFENAVRDLEAAGGGVITVEAGEYPTGSIELKSHITLELKEGAVLRYLQTLGAFPLIELEFEGIPGQIYRPCIFARDSVDVKVTGKGTVDGQGSFWWKPFREKTLQYPRPYLVCFADCRDVTLEGVTLTNSPCWTVHPLRCENVLLKGLNIKNPYDSPNTDGIDPNCCRNVRIEDCTIDVGDDCIALKSGTEDTPVRMPCEEITVSGCRFLHGHGGVVLGSEMSGGVQNIFVDNCTFMGTDVGLRFKSCRGRGGLVENIYCQHIRMMDIPSEAIVFNLFYSGKARGEEVSYDDEGNGTPVALPAVDETTPVFRNIFISDVICKGAGRAIYFNGLPEKRIENIQLSHVTVTGAKEGAVFCESQDIRLDSVHIETLGQSPACRMQGVAGVSVNGKAYDKIGHEQVIPL